MIMTYSYRSIIIIIFDHDFRNLVILGLQRVKICIFEGAISFVHDNVFVHAEDDSLVYDFCYAYFIFSGVFDLDKNEDDVKAVF